MPTTDVFGWTVPTEGGDAGTWDTILNDCIDDDIEGTVNTVKTTADAALPKAGGTMTGNLKTLTQTETVVNEGASLSGTVDFDLSAGNWFYGTVTGNITTQTFSNVPASGTGIVVLVELTNGGAHTITWDASITWDGNTTPTLQSSGVDMLVFTTRDNGTNWYGVHFWTDQ